MTDNFDGLEDYKRKLAREKENNERVAENIRPEWAILKSETESLAGGEIDGEKFEWLTDESDPSLILGSVAAIFQDRQRNGTPTECRVRFDRKPLGPNQVWADPERPFQPLVWSLTLVPEGEGVAWLVQMEQPPLSSSALAKKIAVRLAESQRRYKKHYSITGK